MKQLIIAIVTLSLLLFAAGCSGGRQTTEQQSAAPSQGTTATDKAATTNPHEGTAVTEKAATANPHAGTAMPEKAATANPHAADPHAGMAATENATTTSPHAADPHAGMAMPEKAGTFDPETGMVSPHQGMPPGGKLPAGAHPPVKKAASDIQAPKEGSIAKTSDGSIEEIYAKRGELQGKKIAVRGKVMKFSPMIMERNWIHLQDGSGDASAGTHDLAVTSLEEVKAGETVVVTGTLAADKDFGAGYVYTVILESGQFTREK